MKRYKSSIQAIALFLMVTMMLASCTPTMHLMHAPKSQGVEFKHAGAIVLHQFEDNRPQREKENKVPKNAFVYQHPQKHAPQLNLFVKNTMEQEINESGLFTAAAEGNYELSGKINSFKCINKANGVYLTGYALITLMSGLSLYASSQGGYLGFGAILLLGVPGLVFTMAGKDNIEAFVELEYTLSQNGQPILTDKVHAIQQDQISKMSSKKNLEKTALTLDRALTISIREMIGEIEHHLQERKVK